MTLARVRLAAWVIGVENIGGDFDVTRAVRIFQSKLPAGLVAN